MRPWHMPLLILAALGCGGRESGGGTESGLPLTPELLRDSHCWRDLILQVYECMDGMADVPIVSGMWEPTGEVCTDETTADLHLTFDPPAPNGALSDWLDDRAITFWNGSTDCGTLDFDDRVIGISHGGARAESETRLGTADGADTRYARLTCPDGTTYVAHADAAGSVWEQMPRRNGSVSFQRSESLTMLPPGDRVTLSCRFPAE